VATRFGVDMASKLASATQTDNETKPKTRLSTMRCVVCSLVMLCASQLSCHLVGGAHELSFGTGGGSAGSAGGGANGGAGGGTGGAGGSMPGGCVPSEAGMPVEDSCGVFVSELLGSNSNDGTKEAPLASITTALVLAGDRPIYLCSETFTEPVVINTDAQIYGGLNCLADWDYDSANKTVIEPDDAAVIPLRVQQGTAMPAVSFEDVHFKAADATAAGQSSIAAMVGDAVVRMTRCTLEAGDPAAGDDGALHTTAAAVGIPGIDGENGYNSNNYSGVPSPGAQTTNGSCPTTYGGMGGLGGNNATGAAGQPGGPQLSGSGEGGPDVLTSGNQLCSDLTSWDPDGADGEPGTAGEGATGIGAIDGGGYVGQNGSDGEVGSVAQGGGGGGGAQSLQSNTTYKYGSAGGSGGTGGCGGLGGHGGGFGGSSIALVSLGADVELINSELIAKNGGAGGAGSDGQLGGGGATGGSGGITGSAGQSIGCNGGQGGDGGAGGPGGGGQGGHSLGVAYTGTTVVITNTTVTLGTKGNGGSGGLGPGSAGGADGQAAEALAFEPN